jgi:hypothetical protein
MDAIARWSRPFCNDSGPLIAMPRELIAYWSGSHGPQVEGFGFGFDYWRACEARDRVAALDVRGGVAVVIGAQEGILIANWLSLPGFGALLVGWQYGDNDVEWMVEKRITAGSCKWSPIPATMKVGSGELLLFHGSSAGDALCMQGTSGDGQAVIGDAVPVNLASGRYAIDYCVLGGDLDDPDAPYCCDVVRWLLESRAARRRQQEWTERQ